MGGISRPDIGVGIRQTWQDVTGSRAIGAANIYQGDANKPIQVAVYLGSPSYTGVGAHVEASPDGVAPYVLIGGNSNAGSTVCGVIPKAWFYRCVAVAGSPILANWSELR